MKTVRDVTFDLLRKFGLTTIFGNVGSTEETFLKNFPSDFRYVLSLQEASVIGIADGYAQATRRPALVNVHTGAGLGNAMGCLLTAFQNKTPLIVTAGQQTREMLLMEPWLTNVEPTMMPRPWVKWAYEPVRAQDVPAAFMRAIATALQPPSGPVFLSLPLDDWEKPCEGPAVIRSVATRIAPDRDRLAEFVQTLSRASSPVLIYGAAIARENAWNEAVAFAEALGAPVWAAPASERPPFPEDHSLYCGGLPFAIGPLSEKLKGHDVGLVIGAPVFRYYPYVPGSYLPPGLRLLHISDDPAETARAPVGDSLLGNAVLSLVELTALLKEHKPGVAKPAERVAHRMAPHPACAEQASKDGRLTAAQVFAALSEIRPAHAVIVEESPSNLSELHKAWPITEPDTFYTFASGGLGWNLPASVGIALGERDSGRNRPVIAIIGDGSFQCSVQAIWNAAQLNLPLLIVVLRNEEYCILKSFALLEQTPGVPGLDLPGLDIVSIARGYGCEAARVDDL
ncbi:MAG: benzoylformate decarboxylase, partial [Deltaproteobacteria bacterium]|nr:benzoylformate decarboxylase [Deltaproteobacteria bacterium]